MMKISLVFYGGLLSVFASRLCQPMPPGWKSLDTGPFSLSIPKNWSYQPLKGEDSFIGTIGNKDFHLFFDFSASGYANSLIETEDEYIKSEDWLENCPLTEPGVTYTASFNVHNERLRQMKEKGITDSALVRVEPDPCFGAKKLVRRPVLAEKGRYPNADYIGELIYRGKTTTLPITIPQKIRDQIIKVDTTALYIIKTVYPKITGRGMTGIYFKSRASGLNFQLSGKNLSKEQEEQALAAFKTIQIKVK